MEKETSEKMVQICLHEDHIDLVAKICISYVLAGQHDRPRNFNDALKATIELYEQVADPSVHSVTFYQELLKLLPEGVKRVPPPGFEQIMNKLTVGMV